MLLNDLVETSNAVASTRSRTAKVNAIAALLRRLDGEEVGVATGFLAGEPRQGRIGIGWATLSSLDAAPAKQPSLTILEIDAMLDTIAATTGSGSGEKRAAVLRDVFARATMTEADFLRRLLLGDLRQGALAGIMADAIARAGEVTSDIVRRAWMLSGDLRATAAIALTKGAEGLQAIELQVMRPVEPMLASTADSLDEALRETGRASVEWKLDGIRVQVHRRDDEVRVFTRNLNDITDRVPDVVEVVRSLAHDDLVLDGEAISMDENERPHLFQEIISRVGRRSENEAALVPFFFDVLRAGEDVIDEPLERRSAILDRVAGEWRIPSMVTDSTSEAEAFLQSALDAGHEGVMVKALGSPYQAGRRGKTWRKVKPARTLDLVVIAAEWGYGRRTGWLSNLHLGARDPAGGFVMVGKTFKGLTDETLKWQTEEFLKREVSRSGIVVHVKPELVVEIVLDGVQTSTRYAGGVALRFARVKRYRPDKDPEDADTIDAVRALLARSEEPRP